MNNLINFMSRFGTSAELRNLSREKLMTEMQEADLTQEEMHIILSGSHKDIAKKINNAEEIVGAIVVVAEPEDEQTETKAA